MSRKDGAVRRGLACAARRGGRRIGAFVSVLAGLMWIASLLACGRMEQPHDDDVSAASAALGATDGGVFSVEPARASIPANVEVRFTVFPNRPVEWSVRDPTVASVARSGAVTALKAGRTEIIARDAASGASAAAVLTVTAATLQAIDLQPSPETLGIGGSADFTASGHYSDGTTFDLKRATVTWASDEVGVATVSPLGSVTAIYPGVAEISATDPLTGVSGAATLTVTGSPMASLAITPPQATLQAGLGVPLQAVADATYEDGRKGRLQADLQWSISDPSVASVDAAGRVLGIAPGTATLWATDVATGLAASSTLNVTLADLNGVQVAPSSGSLSIGMSITLHATATFQDGSPRPLPAEVLTWTSSDITLADVSASGTVTCVSAKAGTVTITASSDVYGVKDAATFVVKAATLQTLAITPRSATLPAGVTQPLSLIAGYSDRTQRDVTTTATWATSDKHVAQVSNAPGNEGLVTTLAPGTVTISADFLGGHAMALLTVSNAALKRLEVSPVTGVLPGGTERQLRATGTFGDGTTHDLTKVVTWTSSSLSVAVSNATGSEGTATATAPGQAVITATDPASGIAAVGWLTATPAVLRSLDVSPLSATVPERGHQPFRAVGTFSDASQVDLTDRVLWTSTSPAVVGISNDAVSAGLATGLGVGTADIAVFDPVTGMRAAPARLQVIPIALVSLQITPANPSFPAGTSQQLTATGTFSDGSNKDLTTNVAWSVSSGTAIVTSGPGTFGIVTSQSAGASVVQALDPTSGNTATTTVNATAAALVTIAISPPSPTLAAGTVVSLSATGTFTDGSTHDVTTSVVWTTSNGAASVSNASGSQGLATALAVGSTTVTATDGSTGIAGTTTLTVTAATLQFITLSASVPTLLVGSTQQFFATGTYSDGSTQDLTPSVTWGSSDTTVLAFSNASGSAGLASAVAAGTAIVTATDPATGVVGTQSVIVLAPSGGGGGGGADAAEVDAGSDSAGPNPEAGIDGGAQGGSGDAGTTDGAPDATALPAGPSLAALGTRTCAIVSGGGVVCWGTPMELFNGEVPPLPSAVPGLTSSAIAVSSSPDHGCAVLSDRSVECWDSQPGNGTTASTVAVAVSGLTAPAVTVSSGAGFTCAVLADGSVPCWDDGATPRVPVPMSGLSGPAVGVASGLGLICVVVADGTVQCSGIVANINSSTPVTISGLSGRAVSVAVSASSGIPTDTSSNAACAVLADASIQCWGGGYGATPVTIAGLEGGATQVVVGAEQICALLSDGLVQCWPYDTGAPMTPVLVSGLDSVSVIAAGDEHACAASTVRPLKCWGGDLFGELGNGAIGGSGPVDVILP